MTIVMYYTILLRFGYYKCTSIGRQGEYIKVQRRTRRREIFGKVEPYLTFLNIPQLERQGADIQSKVEELEEINQSLRNRDKLKDDAISQVSDQFVALSIRLQKIERRQQHPT
jgi:hypothetical protein